jgi:uncharacterized membrane protein (UPF0127 family)
MMLILMNDRTGHVVASTVDIATTRAERRQGLLGRDALNDASALVITPCWMIHTGFMRFPIDAIFVDREGVVVRVVRNMKPWRIAVTARAHAVVELSGGGVRDIQENDRLYLRDVNAAVLNVASPTSQRSTATAPAALPIGKRVNA